MRDDAGPLLNLGQEHPAIDTGALDARGMVKRRPDPALGLFHNGGTLAVKFGHLFGH